MQNPTPLLLCLHKKHPFNSIPHISNNLHTLPNKSSAPRYKTEQSTTPTLRYQNLQNPLVPISVHCQWFFPLTLDTAESSSSWSSRHHRVLELPRPIVPTVSAGDPADLSRNRGGERSKRTRTGRAKFGNRRERIARVSVAAGSIWALKPPRWIGSSKVERVARVEERRRAGTEEASERESFMADPPRAGHPFGCSPLGFFRYTPRNVNESSHPRNGRAIELFATGRLDQINLSVCGWFCPSRQVKPAFRPMGHPRTDNANYVDRRDMIESGSGR